MIRVIIFLLAIEEKVESAEGEGARYEPTYKDRKGKKEIDKQVKELAKPGFRLAKPIERKTAEQIKKDKERVIVDYYNWAEKKEKPFRDAAEKPSTGERAKAFFDNIPNIIRNAIDNTVFWPKGLYQNYQTKKYLRENPDKHHKTQVHFTVHGVLQNRGAHHRYGDQIQADTRGGTKKLVYHLRGNHMMGGKKKIDSLFKQVDNFYKSASIKNAYNRDDRITGHSSGGEAVEEMAKDERIYQTGIKAGQKRAGGKLLIKPKRAAQKVVIGFAGEDVSSLKAKEEAVKRYRKEAHIPVQNVVGYADGLVPPYEAVDIYSPSYLIKDKRATHFGTAGSNAKMNKVQIDLFHKEHPPRKYARK